MARMRTIKPAMRTSLVVGKWPIPVRYFYILLWGYLDDTGRGLYIPKRILADCFPFDAISVKKLEKWVTIMSRADQATGKNPPVCVYNVGGIDFIHCINWIEHQRPNRPAPSQYPNCPVHEFSESLSESISEGLTEHLNGNSVPDSLSDSVLELESLKGRGVELGTGPPAELSTDTALHACRQHPEGNRRHCLECAALTRRAAIRSNTAELRLIVTEPDLEELIG